MSDDVPKITAAALSVNVSLVRLILIVGENLQKDPYSAHQYGVVHLRQLREAVDVFSREINDFLTPLHDAYARRGDLPQVSHQSGTSATYCEAWRRDGWWFFEKLAIAARTCLNDSLDAWGSWEYHMDLISTQGVSRITSFWESVIRIAAAIVELEEETDRLLDVRATKAQKWGAADRIGNTLSGRVGKFGDLLERIRREVAYVRADMAAEPALDSKATKVLIYLSKVDGHAVQETIAARIDESRLVVANALKVLRGAGLAATPLGRKTGVAITEAGAQFLVGKGLIDPPVSASPA